MPNTTQKSFGLEDRTFEFARNVRNLFTHIPLRTADLSDKNQVIRSSGSVGANFIEAKEALSKKDFLMRIKICRKEAEETRYWLRLLGLNADENQKALFEPLIQEALELTRIFGSIINKHKT